MRWVIGLLVCAVVMALAGIVCFKLLRQLQEPALETREAAPLEGKPDFWRLSDGPLPFPVAAPAGWKPIPVGEKMGWSEDEAQVLRFNRQLAGPHFPSANAYRVWSVRM